MSSPPSIAQGERCSAEPFLCQAHRAAHQMYLRQGAWQVGAVAAPGAEPASGRKTPRWRRPCSCQATPQPPGPAATRALLQGGRVPARLQYMHRYAPQ